MLIISISVDPVSLFLLSIVLTVLIHAILYPRVTFVRPCFWKIIYRNTLSLKIILSSSKENLFFASFSRHEQAGTTLNQVQGLRFSGSLTPSMQPFGITPKAEKCLLRSSFLAGLWLRNFTLAWLHLRVPELQLSPSLNKKTPGVSSLPRGLRFSTFPVTQHLNSAGPPVS